jgi:hypothetical protein
MLSYRNSNNWNVDNKNDDSGGGGDDDDDNDLLGPNSDNS